MAKLSIEDLKNLRDTMYRKMTNEENPKIIVHMGTCGIASGAQEIYDTIVRELTQEKINVTLKTSGCAGLCSREPMITIQLPGKAPVKYADLNPKKVIKILNQHIRNGVPVADYALAIGSETTY
ncbi:(2Fe-2S) ferredoxin domain-containing protein [candidate division KSB1 bacterium]|nr:(2Fe-2S) ferredoxin domain-containing protein [candidate division KSB1 bacterium]